MADYSESWQEYRKRRNLLLFAFFGYMPIAGFLAFLTTKVFNSETAALVVLGSWLVFYGVAGIRFQMFRCPRCGRWFFAKWWYHNIFARRCVHCGLPKYADPSAS
jgi:hypothetical protein